MPASYRLSWAMRSADGAGVSAVVVAALGILVGALLVASGAWIENPQLPFWCSGVVTAALIGIDFPGSRHPRWAELELSLPLAPRERARARLLLVLGTWLLPLLVSSALAELGAFGAGARLPLASLLRALCSASASVLLVVALRHTLELSGFPAAALRSFSIVIVAAGAVVPDPRLGAVALLASAPLLAVAHRAASREPELLPREASAPPRRASRSATVAGVAFRYAVSSGYAILILLFMVLFSSGSVSGWTHSLVTFIGFVAMGAAYFAGWGARLLRLGHLPYPRERLFRLVAGPPLVAIVLGAAVALLQPPPPGDLGDIEPRGAVTFQAAPSTWRLAIGEPPLVTAPSGESHRPSPHPFGLGSALVMYDPYEAPSSASRAFLVHQLGRLVSEQRELELEPDLLEDLFLYDLQGHRSIGGRDYPDLRVPASRVLGSRLATAAVLLLAALVAFGLIIRPGPARGVRQNVGYWFALSAFVGTQALQLRASSWANDHVDPLTSLSSRLVAYLGRYPELVLPAAVAAGVLLYRLLLRRFQQMEAPPPSKVSDTWFFQI